MKEPGRGGGGGGNSPAVASSHIWAAGAAAPVCGTELQLDPQPFPERGGVTACKGKVGGASLHLWVRPALSPLSGLSGPPLLPPPLGGE